MDAPSLTLVPPTPIHSDPSPSSTSTSVASTPELVQSTIDQERSSSETTIVTIYSMYGDQGGSWSASASADEANGKVADQSLASDSSYRNSLLQSSRYTTSDLAYYDVSTDTRTSSSKRLTVTDRTSVTSNGSARYSCRPSSTLGISTLHNGIELSEDPRASRRCPNNAVPRTHLDSEPLGNPHPRLRPLPRPPAPSYRSRESKECELPPVPTGIAPRRASFSDRPSSSHLRSQKPKTPPPPMPKSAEKMSTPSSKASFSPSDGEDVDAFHIRSTYAHLEMFGVKGDGYEEGVERTRARLAPSRLSELRAEAAMDDGTERTRDLSPKELETLAGLDRYGFFTIPSHDRLIRLPSAPLAKRLTHLSAGPRSAPAHAISLENLPAPPLPVKETSRIAKWSRMLEPKSRDEGGNVEFWGIRASKEHKLRERTYKGIPDRWRGAAWELLMSRFAKTGKMEMLKLGVEYREALDKPSTYDIQIDLDVPRTISGHIMFRTRYGAGQRSLFHVLHSFSLRCPHCGYVQGMGPIAATLLCYFEPERVYASLVRLHDVYSMHTIFSPGFPGLLEAIYVQERITEQMMPDVYAAFKKHMISTTSYATKWYITLFANSVPFQTQLRLWDIFLLEGHDVFVAVAIAVVWAYRDHITSGSANFETILSLLSSFFVPEDENTLLAWIEKMLEDKKLRSSMTRWREGWRDLVAKGEDATALL